MSSDLPFGEGLKKVKEVIAEGVVRLEEAGIGDARHNVDLMAAKAIGTSLSQLPTHWKDTAEKLFCKKMYSMLSRRCLKEPLQYILEEWSFLSLDVNVKSGALIPRPETEEVVIAAIEAIRKSNLPGNFKFSDVGTGTGIIGLSLALEFPEATGNLLDISEEAIKIAKTNLERYPNLKKQLRVLKSDLLEVLAPNSMDVIISNPPYIDSDEIEGLMPEVAKYEPILALDGGLKGLSIIEELIRQSEDKLKNFGLLIFEHGHGQRESIERILSSKWKVLKRGNDFAEKERYFIVRLLKE